MKLTQWVVSDTGIGKNQFSLWQMPAFKLSANKFYVLPKYFGKSLSYWRSPTNHIDFCIWQISFSFSIELKQTRFLFSNELKQTPCFLWNWQFEQNSKFAFEKVDLCDHNYKFTSNDNWSVQSTYWFLFCFPYTVLMFQQQNWWNVVVPSQIE